MSDINRVLLPLGVSSKTALELRQEGDTIKMSLIEMTAQQTAGGVVINNPQHVAEALQRLNQKLQTALKTDENVLSLAGNAEEIFATLVKDGIVKQNNQTVKIEMSADGKTITFHQSSLIKPSLHELSTPAPAQEAKAETTVAAAPADRPPPGPRPQ